MCPKRPGTDLGTFGTRVPGPVLTARNGNKPSVVCVIAIRVMEQNETKQAQAAQAQAQAQALGPSIHWASIDPSLQSFVHRGTELSPPLCRRLFLEGE